MDRCGVEIALLGSFALRGAAAPFGRPAARELIAYLALHRDGVGHSEWPLALWPHRSVSTATVYSTASDARRVLGTGPSGRPLLSRGSPVRLADEVRTDVDRFASFASTGTAEGLARALALVRGPVLAGLRRPDWAVLDGTQASLESLVGRTGLAAARAFMDEGRPDRATWAVRKALLACPYDERLHRALLAAAAVQGAGLALGPAIAELISRSELARASSGVPLCSARASSLVSGVSAGAKPRGRPAAANEPATGPRPARL